MDQSLNYSKANASRAAQPRPGRRRRTVAEPAPALKPLYALVPGQVWRFMKRQPFSYWLMILYVFLEYVRPQNIYEVDWPVTFWTLILCAVVYLFEGFKLRKWTFIDSLLLLFTLVLLASCVTAFSPPVAYSKLTEYLQWVFIFILLTLIINTEERFLVFMTLYLIFCLKMSQAGARHFFLIGWEAWGVSCAPAYFQNSGECGIQMAMYFPTTVYFITALMKYWGKYKRWFFIAMPITAVLTIVTSSSRGALLALAGVSVVMILFTRRRVRSLTTLAVAGVVVWTLVPHQSKDRFRNMGEDSTSVLRLRHWKVGRKVLNDHPVLGIGYNNWQAYLRNRQLPHNIFIQVGSELGYSGLFSLVALIVANFVLNRRTRQMARRLSDGAFLANMSKAFDCALVAFLLGGYFVTVMYYPFFWNNLAMSVALHNSTRRELQRAGQALPPGAHTSGRSSGSSKLVARHVGGYG